MKTLFPTQALILKYIEENPRITRKELAEMLDMDTQPVSAHIMKLYKAGHIPSDIPCSPGYKKPLSTNASAVRRRVSVGELKHGN